MRRTFLSMLAVATVLISFTLGAHAAKGKEMTSEQWMDRMQQHWQQVISEEDPDKRRQLLQEHERLMEQAADSTEMHEETGPGHMGETEHHHNLENSIEMHRHMMDMMR